MIKAETPLSELQTHFDTLFGKKTWVKWEPETILFEVANTKTDVSPLLKEKILVLQVLNENLNDIVSLPEFFIWLTEVTNNESANFEHVIPPSSLEMAWTLVELKKIGIALGKAFTPSPELIDIVAYFLKEEGYSEPLYPFDFIPITKLVSGQTESDTINKKIAIGRYLDFMTNSHKEPNNV